MNTLTLSILSKVNHQTDVFNHLVKVRRHDTGEEGLLLCSHCCKWPKDLIDKADWIEGCYTPPEYEADPRLLMGYHPQSMTRWEYDEEGEVLVLTVPKVNPGNVNNEVTLEDVPTFLPLYEQEEVTWDNISGGRLLRRLWREMVTNGGREFIPAVSAFYRAASALARQGTVPYSSVSCCWLVPEVEAACDHNAVMFDGDFQIWGATEIPESEMYADVLLIVGYETEGYAPAWSLENADEYRMLQFINVEAVVRNENGWNNCCYYEITVDVEEGHNSFEVELRLDYSCRNWGNVVEYPELVLSVRTYSGSADLRWAGENQFYWEKFNWYSADNWILNEPVNFI